MFLKYFVLLVSEEAEPCQRGETEGGHQGKRLPLLRLRVHEGEPLSAHERKVRTHQTLKLLVHLYIISAVSTELFL